MGKRSSCARYSSYADLTNLKDPVVMECIQLLTVSPCSKKEIANRLNLDYSVVHKIYQYNIVDKKVVPAKNAVREQEKEKLKEIKIEEAKEEKEEEEKNMGKQHLSDDMIIALCSDIESGMSYDDAVKKYGCSKATISRHCKSMGVECCSKKKKKKDKAEPIETTVSEVDVDCTEVEEVSETTETDKTIIPAEIIETDPEKEAEFIKVSNSAFIRAALINGRHEMPAVINKYIFEKVEGDNLFDWEWYDNVVRNWIITNIPKKDGVWQKSIDCYVTGLPAASIAVTKVCSEMGVNLTFSHYNSDTAKYEKQVVWNKFPVLISSENDPSTLGKQFDGMDVYILNNTSIAELSNTNSWYCISVRKMIGISQAKIVSIYMVKEYAEIWPKYGQLIQEIEKYTEPYMIQVNKIGLGDKGEYIFKDQLDKHFNTVSANKFKKEKRKY